MPPPKKNKKIQSNPITAIKDELIVSFAPKNAAQQDCVDLWPRSRILFFTGPAGTGKTHCALALSLLEIINIPPIAAKKPMLMLTRPTIAVDNKKMGFLPGSLEEKIFPWLSPLMDVYGEISFSKFEKLQSLIDLQMTPVEMLRGRTIRNGVLIIDEAQDLSPNEIKCALTRIGKNSKIIFCGDPDQSSLYTRKNSPLLNAATRLDDLDVVSTVKFTEADQCRDQLINDILKRL
jgi:phosphate starvation-inducible PhoH-like protein